MADADPLIIGQANTASNPGAETTLNRNEDTPNTLLVVRNLTGSGIRASANGGTSVFATDQIYGVWGDAGGSAVGVYGTSNSGSGVQGTSFESNGVRGSSFESNGVHGSSAQPSGSGVYGDSDWGSGVTGRTRVGALPAVFGDAGGSGPGVEGTSSVASGVIGVSTHDLGVSGISSSWIGVYGSCGPGTGVEGSSGSGTGVAGSSLGSGIGVYGSGGRRAGLFEGYTEVKGTLEVSGPILKPGGFRINHPLSPQNKDLQHSFVESPEMKNVYDGVEQLLEDGTAWIDLPE